MTTKIQFIDRVKRRLGNGATKIHVTDLQIEDAYLRGLDYYYKIVPDSTDVVYYKYQVTQQDVDNDTGIITLPPEVLDVREMHVGRSTNVASIDNGSYAYTNNLVGNSFMAGSQGTGSGYMNLASYYVSVQYMNAVRNLFSPSDLFMYSRFSNKMQLQLSLKNDIGVGGYILFLVDIKIDPEVYTDFHKDELFVSLVSAYIREQQAVNLMKFTGVSLPGGVKFDAEAMLAKAEKEIEKFEKQVYDYYSPSCGIYLL